jgi:hypothetical protein
MRSCRTNTKTRRLLMSSVAEQTVAILKEIGADYVKSQYKKGLVRCVDCRHRSELVPNRNMAGYSAHDKYCPVPINGESLRNAMRSDQAIRTWRRCPNFEWDGKEAK